MGGVVASGGRGGLPAQAPGQPGDVLVHPQHGAVVLEAVETRRLDDRDEDYVVLSASGGLTILAPRNSLGEIGVRPPIGRTRAREVLRTLASSPCPVPPFSSREHRGLWRSVHSGDPIAVARVLRDLAAKESEREGSGRRLSSGERQIFLRATDILASELAVALPTSRERAMARIAEAICGIHPDGRPAG